MSIKKEFTITGKVLDEKTMQPIDMGAKVMLTDFQGNVVDGIGTRTNPDGSYSLVIPIEVKNNPMNPNLPIFLPKGSHITVRPNVKDSHISAIVPLNYKKKRYDVKLKDKNIRTQEDEEEFTVVAVSSKTKCEEMGGTYNQQERLCMMPKSKSKSNRWLIIGGIAVLAIGLGYLAYRKYGK